METTGISIRVEGFDAADSTEGAKSLREFIRYRCVEKKVSDIQIEMSRSDAEAQPVTGDTLEILHVTVLSGLFLVETIKLWHEARRDKAIIITPPRKGGANAVRVEFTNPDASRLLEQAIVHSDAPPT